MEEESCIQTGHTVPKKGFDYSQIMSGEEAFHNTMPIYNIGLNGMICKKEIWNCGIKKYMTLEKNKFGVHDDEVACRLVLLQASKVVFSESHYFYRINSTSITNSFNQRIFESKESVEEEKISEYHSELNRVKQKYAGQIEVYTGLEYDGYTKLENRGLYDYLIGDCHYVKTYDGYHSVDHAKDEQWQAIEKYFDSDPQAYAKAYFETYIERTAINRPDILGHFDLAAKFGFVDESDPSYRKSATEAMLCCLEVTPIVEINTGAISRKIRTTQYPHDFLLKEILSHNGKVILSSDSHRPENLCFWFDEAVKVIKNIGFSSMIILKNGKFEEVGI